MSESVFEHAPSIAVSVSMPKCQYQFTKAKYHEYANYVKRTFRELEIGLKPPKDRILVSSAMGASRGR